MVQLSRNFSHKADAYTALTNALATWTPIEWEPTVEQYLQASPQVQDQCQLMASKAVTFSNAHLPTLHHVLTKLIGATPSTDQLHWMAWWLGMWLAGGRATRAQISMQATQVSVAAQLHRYQQLFEDVVVETFNNTSTLPHHRFNWSPNNSITAKVLCQYGLLHNKHMPRALICDSLIVRRHLLAGIIDTNKSCYELRAKQLDIIQGYKELAATLGLRNSGVVSEPTKKLYQLSLSGNMWDVIQHCAHTPPYVTNKSQNSRSYGFTVAALPTGEYYGFAVHGGINRRFLLHDYTITHNTLCTYAIAKLLGLKVVVVKPTRVTAWKEEAVRCGFDLMMELSYEGLRSVRGQQQPKHGLLLRHDPEPTLRRKRKHSSDTDSDEQQPQQPDSWTHPPPTFEATHKFLQLLRQPILFVLDEVHRGKTRSERTSAISALVNAIVSEPRHRSRCLMLSATQFDQRNHSMTVCQSMGLIADIKQPIPEDSRLVAVARALNPGHPLMADKVIRGFNRTLKSRRTFVYRVYIHILSPILTSAVPKWTIPVNMDCKCGFYLMPKKMEEEVRLAMYDYRKAQETSGRHTSRLAVMGEAIRRTQIAKVSTVVRLVREVFSENPSASVTVLGQSLKALWAIAAELKDVFVWAQDELQHNHFDAWRHVLSGKMTAQQQEATIVEFMSGRCSLLVANLEVGGEGLNLQDRIGDRPRWVFVLPNNHATQLIQGLSRFYRQDTRSDVVVRLVYCRSKNRFGRDVKRERCMLENHKRKDRVWRDLMPEQSQQGAEFLAGFGEFFETDGE